MSEPIGGFGPLVGLQLHDHELHALLTALAVAATGDLDVPKNPTQLASLVWNGPHSTPVTKTLATLLTETLYSVEPEEGEDHAKVVPVLALANNEPMPDNLPPALATMVRRNRARAGVCDHGRRLSACDVCTMG